MMQLERWMKSFSYLLLGLLLPISGYSSGKDTHGGDNNANHFVVMALQAREILLDSHLRGDYESLGEIDLTQYKNAVSHARIEFHAAVFLNDIEVDAINTPSENRIEMNLSRWKQKDLRQKMVLAFHEALGLIRSESDCYRYSAVFAKLLAARSTERESFDQKILGFFQVFETLFMEGVVGTETQELRKWSEKIQAHPDTTACLETDAKRDPRTAILSCLRTGERMQATLALYNQASQLSLEEETAHDSAHQWANTLISKSLAGLSKNWIDDAFGRYRLIRKNDAEAEELALSQMRGICQRESLSDSVRCALQFLKESVETYLPVRNEKSKNRIREFFKSLRRELQSTPSDPASVSFSTLSD